MKGDRIEPAAPSGTWTTTQQALWQRLQDYDFGDGGDGGTGVRTRGFAARLAQVLGGSQASAEAALNEYRRFCFLAVIANQEVTPSKTVDAVWHLHLTDSREYWERFCPHVLGVPLHHLASDGSNTDAARHRAQYQATWDAYRLHFGPPPETFWPPPERHHTRVPAPRMPLSQVWPAPDTGSVSLLICGVLMALVWGFGAASAAEANPLEWRGGWFLLFQLALSALTIVAARRLRRALRDRGSVDTKAEAPTPVELGFLARGASRAADVVVADLLQRGALHVDLPRDAAGVPHPATRSWLRAGHGGELPAELRDALATVRMDERIDKALAAITASQESVRSALERKRLQFDTTTAHAYALMAASLPAFAVVLGVAKIVIGLQRDRPVGLLTVLTTLMAMVTVGFARIPVWHTRAGVTALHLASRRVSTRSNDDDHLLQQVALAGTPVLIGSAYADYHLARTPPPGSASGDGSGTSSCGSSGSGDSGGCGGGGCGGCGG